MAFEKKENRGPALGGFDGSFPDTVSQDWTTLPHPQPEKTVPVEQRLASRRAEVAAVDKLLRAEEALLIEQRNRLTEMTQTADQLQRKISGRERELEQLQKLRLELKVKARIMRAEIEEISQASDAGPDHSGQWLNVASTRTGWRRRRFWALGGLALGLALAGVMVDWPGLAAHIAPSPPVSVVLPHIPSSAVYDGTAESSADLAAELKIAPQLNPGAVPVSTARNDQEK